MKTTFVSSVLCFAVLSALTACSHRPPLKVLLAVDCTDSNFNSGQQQKIQVFLQDILGDLQEQDKVGLLVIKQKPEFIRSIRRSLGSSRVLRKAVASIPACDSKGNSTIDALRLAAGVHPDVVVLVTDGFLGDDTSVDRRAVSWEGSRVLAVVSSPKFLSGYQKHLPEDVELVPVGRLAAFDFGGWVSVLRGGGAQ